MEYLSLPHTRASSYKLVPEVSDTLLTNLRNPIITLVEDTTPGAHDTLTAACDANLYTALGVSAPAEHGSCAENLVLALKELNENAGLKGAKAVGADISVNIAPTPLHLFMVAPIALAPDANTSEAGAKGAKIAVSEPKGKKRGFVRFRAERDVVVVFSACPMDVGPQNGGRCMAANFMVEEADADDAASVKSQSEKKAQPKKLSAAGNKDDDKAPAAQKSKPKKLSPKQDSATEGAPDARDAHQEPDTTAKEKPKPKKLNAPNDKGEDKRAERKSSDSTESAEKKPGAQLEKTGEKTDDKASEKGSDAPSDESAKIKKKPKKLQVRSKQ